MGPGCVFRHTSWKPEGMKHALRLRREKKARLDAAANAPPAQQAAEEGGGDLVPMEDAPEPAGLQAPPAEAQPAELQEPGPPPAASSHVMPADRLAMPAGLRILVRIAAQCPVFACAQLCLATCEVERPRSGEATASIESSVYAIRSLRYDSLHCQAAAQSEYSRRRREREAGRFLAKSSGKQTKKRGVHL